MLSGFTDINILERPTFVRSYKSYSSLHQNVQEVIVKNTFKEK